MPTHGTAQAVHFFMARDARGTVRLLPLRFRRFLAV